MAGRTTPPEPAGASGLRLAVVASEFHRAISDVLVAGARDWLRAAGAAPEIHWVPGAFELPLACRALARSGRYDALVALGCVIRGATPHFEFVAGECARGIMSVMLETGVPVAFGVLTTEDEVQARERAGGGLGNKGADAAASAVTMAALLSRMR